MSGRTEGVCRAPTLPPLISPLRGVSSRFAEREFAMPVAWRKASERRDAAKQRGPGRAVASEASRVGVAEAALDFPA